MHSRVRHSLTSSRRFLILWQTNAWQKFLPSCAAWSARTSQSPTVMPSLRWTLKKIAEGKTNQQIIDFMVDRYGDFVLYNPPFKMSTLLLWLGPILFLVLALGGLFYTMAKRKKLKPVELTEEQKRRAEELLRGTEPAKRRDAK